MRSWFRSTLPLPLALPLALAVLLAAALLWLLWGWPPTPGPEQARSGGQASNQAGEVPGDSIGEGAAEAHRQLALAAPPRGGDFTLASVDGPVSLADFRGKVVLLYFGYTWCPDICPTNLAMIGQALRQLTGAERDRVQVLFVSVDPERDDPARLAEYVGYFDPSMIGVTGDEAQVAAAAALYGAAYRRTEQPGSAMGYLVDHSASTYLIDRKGALRETLPHATPPGELLARLRGLLADAG
jgi:protein SCO1/2